MTRYLALAMLALLPACAQEPAPQAYADGAQDARIAVLEGELDDLRAHLSELEAMQKTDRTFSVAAYNADKAHVEYAQDSFDRLFGNDAKFLQDVNALRATQGWAPRAGPTKD